MNLISKERGLLAMLTLGFVIRLVSVAPVHSASYTSDEREYIYLAKKIAAGGEFVDSNGNRSTRSPLFPISLGYLFRFLGESLWLYHIIGCILGTLVIYLGYKLCIVLWTDPQVALVSAGAMALYPGLVIYSGLLHTETVYIVFMMLALIAAFRLMNEDRTTDALLLGVTSGLAALTRPVFLGFLPVLLLLVWRRRRTGGRKSVMPIALSSLMFILILLPWTVRNYALQGAVVPVSSWSLLTGNNPYATGTWSMKPGFDEWYQTKAAEAGISDPAKLTELERGKLDRSLALDYVASHPFRMMELAMKKAYMFWVYPITHTSTYLPVQALAVVADSVLYLGAAVGLVALWSARRRLLPVFGAILFFSLVQVVLHAEARFRLPLVPLLCLFFGWGVTTTADSVKRTTLLSNRRHRFAAGALMGFIVLIYCLTGVLFLTGKV